MHGVPSDLDLTGLIGTMLQRIDLGMYIIHFRFDTHTIAVEGEWELRGPESSVLDRDMEPSDRRSYQLHVLLGKIVTATELDAPESFALSFDSGHSLRVYDRSPQYESFSIQPGNIFI